MAVGHTDEMELRAQIEEDYLTCQICQGPFKRPKALTCLHSFCAYCLDEYLTAKKVPAGVDLNVQCVEKLWSCQ